MALTAGQAKVLIGFFSNLSVAWLVATFITPSLVESIQLAGGFFGSGLSLGIALFLAKQYEF